jgi:hypothetical protein
MISVCFVLISGAKSKDMVQLTERIGKERIYGR